MQNSFAFSHTCFFSCVGGGGGHLLVWKDGLGRLGKCIALLLLVRLSLIEFKRLWTQTKRSNKISRYCGAELTGLGTYISNGRAALYYLTCHQILAIDLLFSFIFQPSST